MIFNFKQHSKKQKGKTGTKKGKQLPVNQNNLTGSQRRKLIALKKKHLKHNKKMISAQRSIPFKEMFKDGICKVQNGYYTKTIEFFDLNYQLAQNEDKNIIFENYCDFLNYFDNSISFQLSFVNKYGDMEEMGQSLNIQFQNDSFDDVWIEYSEMLKNQLSKGNNGLLKQKYITFGIEADNLRAAKPRLERVESNILNNFKVLGAKARTLNGAERLKLMHGCFHPHGGDKFRFDWSMVAKTGLTSKDFIAPTSFTFRDGKAFQSSNVHGAVSFIQILAPELTDRTLADFLDMDTSQIINIHIQALDQAKAIKAIKATLSNIDKMKI